MPVRFACPRCQTRLSVGRRKIGASTECPKCRSALVVPNEYEAETSLLLAGIAKSDAPATDAQAHPEFVVYDEVPDLVGRSSHAPPPATTARPMLPDPRRASASAKLATVKSVPIAPPSQDPTGGKSVAPALATRDRSLLLVSRRVLYLQGALIALVAVVAFLVGYWSGHGDARSDVPTADSDALDPVVIEGKLVYGARNGTVSGDAGAVVVALPVDASPPTGIRATGLRPRDPEPAPDHPGVAAIGQLGGTYLRADEQGAFSLVVPRPGSYYVLLLSRQTGRPSSRTADASDLAQLSRYFARPTDLLGSRKYHLERWLLDGDTRPISHDFGRHLE